MEHEYTVSLKTVIVDGRKCCLGVKGNPSIEWCGDGYKMTLPFRSTDTEDTGFHPSEKSSWVLSSDDSKTENSYTLTHSLLQP